MSRAKPVNKTLIECRCEGAITCKRTGCPHYRIETFRHYLCYSCYKWWSISVHAAEKEPAKLACPHCGRKLPTVENKPAP